MRIICLMGFHKWSKVSSGVLPRIGQSQGGMMSEGSSSEPCKGCGGEGRKVYGSTSTYLYGIGGAAMTEDWCDRCWGTGLEHRKGPNLKEMAKASGEILRGYRRRLVKARKQGFDG